MRFSRVGRAALVLALLAACTHYQVPRSGLPPRDPATDQVISLENFDHALLSRAIFWESNRARAAHGVAPLAPLPALDAAADEQATYMALILSAEHENPIPRERNVAERVERAGLRPACVAENAIMMPARRPADQPDRDYTYAGYAAFLVEGWMDSPSHRANLLDPVFSHLGCAARLAHGPIRGDQRIFATQVFFLLDPAFPIPK